MSEIQLRRWSENDAGILNRGNTPEMTRHLGGPETDEQLAARHERYLRLWRTSEARSFVIVDGNDPLGAICSWKTTWRDQDVLEAGWFIVPEAQRRGAGSAALALLITDARVHGEGRSLLTAFPDENNAPSNALCRSSGFTLAGQRAEVFRGAELAMNEWVFDLSD